jgi:cytochrome c6
MSNRSIIKFIVAATCISTAFAGIARAEDAGVIWTKTCAACHGKDGKGQTKMGRKVDVKDYTDSKVQAELTDEKATKALKEGIKDDKGKERMKAYGDQYSDEEIKSLIAYIRAFKPK